MVVDQELYKQWIIEDNSRIWIILILTVLIYILQDNILSVYKDEIQTVGIADMNIFLYIIK